MGGSKKSGYGLVFYDDILLEIVSNEVSEEAQREFLGRLFRDVPEEKLREEMQLLQTLYACNGSISQTAEKLYLHKNTVQYKLNRIAERTGYDPRKSRCPRRAVHAVLWNRLA